MRRRDAVPPAECDVDLTGDGVDDGDVKERSGSRSNGAHSGGCVTGAAAARTPAVCEPRWTAAAVVPPFAGLSQPRRGPVTTTPRPVAPMASPCAARAGEPSRDGVVRCSPFAATSILQLVDGGVPRQPCGDGGSGVSGGGSSGDDGVDAEALARRVLRNKRRKALRKERRRRLEAVLAQG